MLNNNSTKEVTSLTIEYFNQGLRRIDDIDHKKITISFHKKMITYRKFNGYNQKMYDKSFLIDDKKCNKIKCYINSAIDKNEFNDNIFYHVCDGGKWKITVCYGRSSIEMTTNWLEDTPKLNKLINEVYDVIEK